jgi:serine/threonine protein kinase/Tol biopolymer transport system component
LSLTPGTRLGVYEITAAIGEGGMGQVYRATDTKLKRRVAIKILPPSLAADHDRLARFQREAEVLASLNHPHIAGIYGLEESDGISALVMELVEGDDLSQRIARGAIPLDEALPIVKQIAEALEAAHEQGIIHRDLKPANIKVRADGTVKVLDFGLAKAIEPAGGSSPSMSLSPTLSMHATQAGIILGTAAYMAPEQARGKVVDKRADIWAFGVVLFEMLTGTTPFPGEDISHVLARVIERDPDFDSLPSSVPARITQVLRLCLRKDPKQRVGDIRDVRLALEGAFETAAMHATAPTSTPRSAWSRVLPWSVAAGLAVALTFIAALWAPWRMPAPVDQPLMEFEISPPEGTSFGPVNTNGPAAVSPDGRQVVLVARAKDGTRTLWLRPLASNSPRVLPGTENALDPSWSPDGRWVYFVAGGKLKRISVDGGQPQVIADTGTGLRTSNAVGVTLFADVGKAVQRIATAGGTPAPVFELDAARGEVAQNGPQFLPDGNHFLYISNARETGVVLASLDGKARRFLFAQSGSPAYYAPNPAGGTGWLLYAVTNQLFARPFDPAKAEVAGEPVPIADSVSAGPFWSVSNNGVLMFRHSRPSQTQLTWFSRDGKQLGVVGEAGTLGRPHIAPDQKTVAFSRTSDRNSDVWLLDLARNATTRFTFEPGLDGNPAWSADGQRLFYDSQRQDELLVVERPASGIGAERIVTKGRRGAALLPTGVSKDGHWLVLSEGGAGQSRLSLLSLVDGRSVPVTETESASSGSVSPDGRWLLYTLYASGRNEVFVRTLPMEAGGSAAAGRWQVSSSGGGQPTWRADGKEIFYLSPEGALMAVPVESGENSFRPGTPRELFRTREASSFDVVADGQRFLVNQVASDSSDTPVTVIVNWPQLLKK